MFLRTLILLLFLSCTSARADEKRAAYAIEMDAQYLISRDGFMPMFDVLFLRDITKRVGAFAFAGVSLEHVEWVVGATYAALPFLKIGAGGGIESSSRPSARGTFLVLAHNRQYSILAMLEYGGTGFGARAEANFQAWHEVGFGAFLQTGAGVGPRVQVSLPLKMLKVWAAPLYDYARRDFAYMIALRFDTMH